MLGKFIPYIISVLSLIGPEKAKPDKGDAKAEVKADVKKAVIADYKEYNTDTTIRFLITCLPGKLADLEHDGLHKIFKLQSMISTTSMCVFDDLGCLRR